MVERKKKTYVPIEDKPIEDDVASRVLEIMKEEFPELIDPHTEVIIVPDSETVVKGTPSQDRNDTND